MSSSPPAPAKEERHGVVAETGTEVDDGGAVGSDAASPSQVVEVDDGEEEDTADDDEDDDVASYSESEVYDVDNEDDTADGDDEGDVGGNEEASDDVDELPTRTDFEAAVEAVWRKVAAVEEEPSVEHTCSICMEPWTCDGAHRIW